MFQRNPVYLAVLGLMCVSTLSFSAEQKRAARPAPAAARPAPPRAAGPQQRFVLDVVRSAVALPQSDPQDRLRVLHAAINVVYPLAPRLAQQLSREGVQLEAELIRSGQKPAVSVFDAGRVDCVAAVQFVESLPSQSVVLAEQSLLSAIGNCPRTAVEPARQKLDAALSQGMVAARPLLAVIDATGATTPWSQAAFRKIFAALPRDSATARSEAPNYAAMFVRMAPESEKDATRDAGISFLEWLSKVPDSGERSLAVSLATGAMKNALGEEHYSEALRSSPVAAGIARNPGRPGAIERPEEDNVSVLEAMQNVGRDRTDALRALPPNLRAKQAAADGFAAGNDGNRKAADHYFDIAFAAVDEVWKARADRQGAPAVVEEVSGAAAHVDAVAALTRAQRLQDPSAQAIAMLAVARVVLGQASN